MTTIFLSCLGPNCVAQELSKDPPAQEWRNWGGTDLWGSNCKPADNPEHQGARICSGVEGYLLLVKGDEVERGLFLAKPEIYLIAPNGRHYPLRYWNTTDPKYQGLHRSVSWITVNTPRETIALTFTLKVAQRQDYTYSDSYSIIVRVSPSPVCIVGSVAGSSTSAGESVGIASSPRGRPCLNLNEYEKRDWFLTARRLAKEGQINAARRALRRVREPSERFIVYREMASSQYKRGNSEAARRILIRARAEALKNRFGDGLNYTLSHVVSGLAESGFYDAAKADIRLFPEADRLQMYLTVAFIQGERNDLDAARKTFQEAIQREVRNNPQADGRLYEIGMAQTRMGLLDEAGKTASMIRDPSLRQMVETRISDQSPKPE
ncbi:MAG TPA: hypothetical protein VFR78_18315 [Pyrinomonadaceae bacterium]|nr:hypothetical protein [Pyrinomonadaceae bacterium]